MDPLAVYGATLATASIAWQIFTWWHKGAKLRGFANPNMIMVGSDKLDNNSYITLDVSNVGDAPTTIINVVLMGFSSRLARIRCKESKAAIVYHALAQTIPYTLPAGARGEKGKLLRAPRSRHSRNASGHASGPRPISARAERTSGAGVTPE